MYEKVFQRFDLSRDVRKPDFCICENKDADQRLCFRHLDSTIPLLSKSEISSLKPSSVAVQPGLCRTWSETPKTGFLTSRLILYAFSLSQATGSSDHWIMTLFLLFELQNLDFLLFEQNLQNLGGFSVMLYDIIMDLHKSKLVLIFPMHFYTPFSLLFAPACFTKGKKNKVHLRWKFLISSESFST